MIVLSELGSDIYETAKEKGFWDGKTDINKVLAKIALMHSEGSEILEAIRKQKGDDAITSEFADYFIRGIDLFEGLARHGWIGANSDLEAAIKAKVEVNKSRPKMHGNLA